MLSARLRLRFRGGMNVVRPRSGSPGAPCRQAAGPGPCHRAWRQEMSWRPSGVMVMRNWSRVGDPSWRHRRRWSSMGSQRRSGPPCRTRQPCWSRRSRAQLPASASRSSWPRLPRWRRWAAGAAVWATNRAQSSRMPPSIVVSRSIGRRLGDRIQRRSQRDATRPGPARHRGPARRTGWLRTVCSLTARAHAHDPVAPPRAPRRQPVPREHE